MVYKWRFTKYPVDAQVAGEELERICESHGALTPEIVLNESREQAAVLHNCFEWDDIVAAESWRREQAGQIIRQLVTVTVAGKETSEPVRAFVQIENTYKPIEQVIVRADYVSAMLQNAKKELQSFRLKYSTLTQLQSVFAAIDDLPES